MPRTEIIIPMEARQSSPVRAPVDVRPLIIGRVIPEYRYRRFPSEWRMLELGGVAPEQERKANDNLDRYARKLGLAGDDEYYGNIGVTAAAVAYNAGTIGAAILGEGDTRIDSLVRDAFIHDGDKGWEIVRRKASELGLLSDPYSEEAYNTADLFLREQGEDPAIINEMMKVRSATGHLSLHRFVILNSSGDPILNPALTLEEKIIHHADDVTFSPVVKEGEQVPISYLTFPEYMDAADFQNRYPFIYKKGFGFDASGQVVLVEDIREEISDLVHVRSYADWQLGVAAAVAKDLMERIPQKPGENRSDPEIYLKNLVNASIS